MQNSLSALLSIFLLFSSSLGDETRRAVNFTGKQVGEIEFSGAPVAKTFDVGSVELNRQTNFKIKIHNSSSKDLEFRGVKSSCGCLTAIPVTKQIPSTETEYVFASLSLPETGDFEKKFTIGYGEFSSDSIAVVLRGKSCRRFEIEPARVDVGVSGESGQLTVTSRFCKLSSVSKVLAGSSLLKRLEIASRDDNRMLLSYDVDTKKLDEPSGMLPVNVFFDTREEQIAVPVKFLDSLRVRVFPRSLICKSAGAKLEFRGALYANSKVLQEMSEHGKLYLAFAGTSVSAPIAHEFRRSGGKSMLFRMEINKADVQSLSRERLRSTEALVENDAGVELFSLKLIFPSTPQNALEEN